MDLSMGRLRGNLSDADKKKLHIAAVLARYRNSELVKLLMEQQKALSEQLEALKSSF